jgi:hypothetical protein
VSAVDDDEDVEPSPRTAAEPMAFTKLELLRGAVVAWIAFNAIVLLQALGWGDRSWAIVGFFMAVLITGLLGPLLVLPSCIVGHALRRTRPIVVHVAAQAAVGALMAGAVLIAGWLAPNSALDLFAPSTYAFVIAAAIALPLGWVWAYFRARRSDLMQRQRPS